MAQSPSRQRIAKTRSTLQNRLSLREFDDRAATRWSQQSVVGYKKNVANSVSLESMPEVVVLDELKGLETELHSIETRRNTKRMEMLLHRDFVEFGRSGQRYSRADILHEFRSDRAFPAVHSENFNVVLLAQDVALLTYLSAHLDAAGKQYRHTLRSSVWVRTQLGWQMRFHQGTPVAASTPT